MGNPDYPKNLQEWAEKYPEKYDLYKRWFSLKQTKGVYNFYNGFNNWFLNSGQAPVIYNELKTKKTVHSFEKYFFNHGFFEVEVDYDEKDVEEKEKEVTYKITTHSQYYIDTIEPQISSPVLDSLYHHHIKKTYLKPGTPFVFELFENEQARLTQLFRNSGVFHFSSDYIGFWTDSTHIDKYKKIVLKIPDRRVVEGDSAHLEPFRIITIKKVNVYTDFDMTAIDEQQNISENYEGITYYAPDKLRYNPKYLSDAIFIRPGMVYSDISKNLTVNHLRKLQNFKTSIKIDYIDNKDGTVSVNIYLVRLKKYAITTNLDATTSNIKPFGILGKFSFLDKNLFKGAEILELSFQGSFLNVSKDASTSDRFFNAFEVMINSSLTIPRIFFPLNTDKIIPKKMSPQSVINLSSGIQKNIGLDRQTLTTGLNYSWRSSERVGHKFDLYNLQYIENKNTENYFKIYQSEYDKLNETSENILGVPLPENNKENYELINSYMNHILDPDNHYEDSHPDDYDDVSDVNERKDILTEDILVPVISYGLNYSTKKNLNDQDFYFITGRVVSSGTLSTLLASKRNEEGKKVLFGLPIAQYIKTEFEFKKYWDMKNENIMVFRTFIGAAIPFGNSDNIPFSRSYNAGGSNDIRAWRTFDLGPGGELNTLEYNVGSFKMVTNLEYRFKVFDKIYSALFVDVGNIWDITDSNLVSEAGKFTGLKSLKNSAIGSGFGIRYNFGFLVFRLDIGFKTYEPYLISQDKWFTNYNFGNAVYNIGINYPF
jgi:outer membrane protein assembly factor BamA